MNTESNDNDLIKISDSLLTVELPIDVVKAYSMRPDNSILARACRVALGDEPTIKNNKKIT